MLKETSAGVIIPIKVSTQANKNEILGWKDEELCVRIAAVPEKGQANKTLLIFLAKKLAIARSHLQLMKGQKSIHKQVLVSGLNAQQVAICLEIL